jgi:hypothetical protein
MFRQAPEKRAFGSILDSSFWAKHWFVVIWFGD